MPKVFRAGDERVGIVVPGCDDAERSMTQVERAANFHEVPAEFRNVGESAGVPSPCSSLNTKPSSIPVLRSRLGPNR
jgi:hypothetical protein